MKSPFPGVNLGGWLVLEKWMTPSLFKGTSATNEYELSQVAGKVSEIKAHHETFITEQDIAWLQSVGIRHVRVPVGFWLLHGYHPYVSARGRFEWLLEMAKKYDIQVLLCLHAAPGPQNSNDHSGSGRPGGTGWYTRTNQRMTRHVLIEFAERYGAHPNLWGIELMNEPAVQTRWQRLQLWWWTKQTIKVLRQKLPERVRLVASDCYNPAWWSGRVRGATLDIHHYQCFSPADRAREAYEDHKVILQAAEIQYQRYARQQPLIIGEWSATLPANVQTKTIARQFCQDQSLLLAYADVWFFWSYKTEHAGTWNFRSLYEEGYFTDVL